VTKVQAMKFIWATVLLKHGKTRPVRCKQRGLYQGDHIVSLKSKL